MLTTDTAVMLATYSDWADQILFKAMRDLPGDAVYRPRKTLFGSMIGTLNHNYQVDLIWRAHLLGQKHGFSTRRDLLHPDLGALVEEQSTINEWYIDWAKTQTPESLGERLTFNFVSGKSGGDDAGRNVPAHRQPQDLPSRLGRRDCSSTQASTRRRPTSASSSARTEKRPQPRHLHRLAGQQGDDDGAASVSGARVPSRPIAATTGGR